MGREGVNNRVFAMEMISLLGTSFVALVCRMFDL